MDTSKIAKQLVELKNRKGSINLPDKFAPFFNKPESIDLSSDKVGFSLEDALHLEAVLSFMVDERTADEPYKKSNVSKTIDKHSDQVKPKRSTSDVLNECKSLATSLQKLFKKR